jgi:hydrogenase maturation protein HypF
MVKDLKQVNLFCQCNDQETQILKSAASPIVLLNHKPYSGISPEVAPGLASLGVMLPYTPLHHLLMQEIDMPLVMTSGNLSEEPIAAGNDEALERLRGIADYFLLHNRDIHSQYDDSVVVVEQGRSQVVRRARGYAPFPVKLPFPMQPILACGAEVKSTFCLTRDNHAFLSQHIGDLKNEETLEHFDNTEKLYEELFRIRPEIVACDFHPDYLSTKWAAERAMKYSLPLVPVQHHHAHIVSCMADNSVFEPVIGVAFDGTGYGPDGHICGEFMT